MNVIKCYYNSRILLLYVMPYMSSIVSESISTAVILLFIPQL